MKYMKISRSKLAEMIKESIKKHVINESRCFAHAIYIPSEMNIISDEELSNMPDLVKRIFYNKYNITFRGNFWCDPGYNEYGTGYGCPSSSGIDDIELEDDDNLLVDIETLSSVYPELAQRLKNNFNDWCIERDGSDLDVEEYEPDWDD